MNLNNFFKVNSNNQNNTVVNTLSHLNGKNIIAKGKANSSNYEAIYNSSWEKTYKWVYLKNTKMYCKICENILK
jgi:hypothetical protein